jgi:acyl carrier protein
MTELQDSPEGERPPRARVMDLVARILGHADATPPLPVEARLSELGMSSMKMISLMIALEVEFDLAIPQGDITPDNFESIASVQALIGRLLGSAGGV